MEKGEKPARSGIQSLLGAKAAKRDEFHTQVADIENGLKHYRDHFLGKVVWCGCDSPFYSIFFRDFVAKFNTIALKKLICTRYSSLPIMRGWRLLIEMEGLEQKGKEPCLFEINDVANQYNDGTASFSDVEGLVFHLENTAGSHIGDEENCRGTFCKRNLSSFDGSGLRVNLRAVFLASRGHSSSAGRRKGARRTALKCRVSDVQRFWSSIGRSLGLG